MKPGLAVRGFRAVVLASLVLLAAEVTQIGLGYGRRLALHVPLGVAIFGLTVALALASWPLARPAREGSVSGSAHAP